MSDEGLYVPAVIYCAKCGRTGEPLATLFAGGSAIRVELPRGWSVLPPDTFIDALVAQLACAGCSEEAAGVEPACSTSGRAP